MNNNDRKVLFSSKSDEWETPKELFDELDAEFDFILDVCAVDGNQKCLHFISPEIDALATDWVDYINRTTPGATPISEEYLNFFMNPPYSQVAKWIEKAAVEAIKGATIVALVPARTDTRWFHNYVYKKPNVEVRFIKGRLKFSDSKNSAPFPSMVVIFRPLDTAKVAW